MSVYCTIWQEVQDTKLLNTLFTLMIDISVS
jgi:hypothetical protein